MFLFLACCSVALLIGAGTYLSIVRPLVRSEAHALSEAQMLEVWWSTPAARGGRQGRAPVEVVAGTPMRCIQIRRESADSELTRH
jgi:hypothetical protein